MSKGVSRGTQVNYLGHKHSSFCLHCVAEAILYPDNQGKLFLLGLTWARILESNSGFCLTHQLVVRNPDGHRQELRERFCCKWWWHGALGSLLRYLAFALWPCSCSIPHVLLPSHNGLLLGLFNLWFGGSDRILFMMDSFDSTIICLLIYHSISTIASSMLCVKIHIFQRVYYYLLKLAWSCSRILGSMLWLLFEG